MRDQVPRHGGGAGSVTITCCTVPVTGRSSPTMRPIRAAQGPAAFTTRPATIGPLRRRHAPRRRRRGRSPAPRRRAAAARRRAAPASAPPWCRAAGRRSPRPGTKSAPTMRSDSAGASARSSLAPSTWLSMPQRRSIADLRAQPVQSGRVLRQHQPAFGADAQVLAGLGGDLLPQRDAARRERQRVARPGRRPPASRRRNRRTAAARAGCRHWRCWPPCRPRRAPPAARRRPRAPGNSAVHRPASAAADHQHVAAGAAARPAATRCRRAGGRGTAEQRRLELRRLEHQRRGGHRAQRRARRGEAVVVRGVGAEPGDGGGAEAPLAAAHAGARRLLQRRQRGQAVGQRRAQAAGRDLLAAADDGSSVERAGDRRPVRRNSVHSASWKSSARAQRGARRRIVGRGEAEVARRRQPGQPAARHGHARAAERRAVADGEDRRATRCGRPRRSRVARWPSPSSTKRCGSAQRAGQPGLRLEAEVQRARHPPRSRVARRHARTSAATRPSPSQRGDLRAPQHRHAGARAARAACRCPRAPGPAPARSMRQPPAATAAGPGRGAASTTASGLTPPASSSQASCRFSGPLPAISTRSPGQTRWARTRVCNAPVVITPGRVQPGSGTGRSCAPGASTSRRGRKVTRGRADQGGDLVRREAAPDGGPGLDLARRPPWRGSRSASPRRNCASGAASAWLSASGLAYCPPVRRARPAPPPGAGLGGGDRRRTARPGRRRPPARRRRWSAASPVGFGAERRRRAGAAPVTTMPSATLVMQARWPMRPSTVTTQSKQAPMPQCRPRGAPLAVRRNATMPAADSAAAMSRPAAPQRPRRRS